MLKVTVPTGENIAKMAKEATKGRSLRKVVNLFEDSNAYLPVIALEACVESGRTYQAYKRGGFDEARERITEEFSGAVFWLGGIPAFNYLFNKFGKKALKLPKEPFSIASDNIRKPLPNFLAKMKSLGNNVTSSQIAKFKIAQTIAGVIVVNSFIGFVVPKINQAITRWYHKNKKTEINPKTFEMTQAERAQSELMAAAALTKPRQSLMSGFYEKAEDEKRRPNPVSFGMNPQHLLNIANTCENSRNFKLLSVDAGTVSGRTISARNNDERCEIAIRDLGSIYFYMFNAPNLNRWLNQAEQNGRKTRLNSLGAKYTSDYLTSIVSDKSNNLTIDEMKEALLGDSKAVVPESITKKIAKGRISLDDFNTLLKQNVSESEYNNISSIAKKMSELQPKIKDTAILTEGQVRDIFKGGAINNPDFLKELYKISLGDDVFDAFKFVHQSKIETVKSDVEFFIDEMITNAKKKNITELSEDIIRKAQKSNLRKNALNIGVGFAVSALFLSTLIPKIQYAFTKWRTGSNAFPGTKDLDKDVKKSK